MRCASWIFGSYFMSGLRTLKPKKLKKWKLKTFSKKLVFFSPDVRPRPKPFVHGTMVVICFTKFIQLAAYRCESQTDASITTVHGRSAERGEYERYLSSAQLITDNAELSVGVPGAWHTSRIMHSAAIGLIYIGFSDITKFDSITGSHAVGQVYVLQ